MRKKQDITNTNLEAALLDQTVAATFGDQLYAYIAVVADGGWQLGIAVANERGYHPVGKRFKAESEASAWADGLNAHIGLSRGRITEIIISTMGGRAVRL